LSNSGFKKKKSKDSKIQENWKECYIVELVVGFLKMYIQYRFEEKKRFHIFIDQILVFWPSL
jgi:hypothetical protein